MVKISSDNYGVIGVGIFGAAVAKTLSEAGKNVIALDINQEKLKEVSEYVTDVYKIDALNKESLEEAGIGNCKTVVVGIGENVEASILATLDCLELGVEHVISKAGTREHGKILEKLGATAVYPEEESGERTARNLMSRANLETLPLSDDFSIISLDANPSFAGKTILELNWRNKYSVNVIAITENGELNADIRPETVVPQQCRLVLSGSNKALDKFRDFNSKGLE